MLRGLSSVTLLSLALTLLACGDARRSAGEAERALDPPFIAHSTAVESGLQGVVMIVVDTLRADHVGAYGSDRGLTPRIDALAERSYLFERAVAASSWTRPSIAAMLTSRFPTSMGLLDKTDSLPDAAVTLPEVLRNQADYQTLAVITNGNIDAQWGFDQGFDRFVWPHLRRQYPDDFPIHVAEGVTQKALELLDERDPGRPFFLFVLYVDPHDPYLPHPEILDEPAPPGRFDGSREELKKLDRLRLRAEAEDYDRTRHLYAGEVKYADHWIGRLLDGLDERGLTDEVLIALTADHGEGLWSHGLRGHGNDLYEESVHVPLLLRYPGTTSAEAARIEPPVSLVDLAPTILAAAGAPKPPSFQGFDLRAVTRGESRGSAFDYVYTEMDHRGRNYEAVRQGDWKLIRNRRAKGGGADAVALYDLASDPEEKRSRLRNAPSGVRRPLADALQRWSLAVLAHSASRSRIALSEIDEETLESLRGLGYIGDAELAAALSSRGTGSAGGPAPDNLPPVPLTALDLTGPPDRAVRAQIEGGLALPGPGNPGAAIESEASVLLHREGRHEKWRVELTVGMERGSGPVVFSVHPTGDEPVRTPIHEPGSYVVEGPLPEESGPTVRLALECEREEAAESGRGEPCAILRRIDLR